MQTLPTPTEERPIWPAIRRGWRRRCPNCGQGAVLHSYLKVNDACGDCGLTLSLARADNGPAYLSILITGKVMITAMLYVFVAYRPDPMTMAVGFSIGAVALSLYLLPRLKGMIVGIQWANRMHGF